MEGSQTTIHEVKHKQTNRTGVFRKKLTCMQINLQHSRLATDNLLKIMEEEVTDIVCIQKPYNIGR
jgi:hypothetical protein